MKWSVTLSVGGFTLAKILVMEDMEVFFAVLQAFQMGLKSNGISLSLSLPLSANLKETVSKKLEKENKKTKG